MSKMGDVHAGYVAGLVLSLIVLALAVHVACRFVAFVVGLVKQALRSKRSSHGKRSQP